MENKKQVTLSNGQKVIVHCFGEKCKKNTETDNWYKEINLLQEKHNSDGVGKSNYYSPGDTNKGGIK